LLPGMLALVVAVLFSLVLAWVVAIVLRRFLDSIQFDKQLERWGFTGIAELSPRQSLTLLVTRMVAWTIVLIGFVLGLARSTRRSPRSFRCACSAIFRMWCRPSP
jgi:hypothetical protein